VKIFSAKTLTRTRRQSQQSRVEVEAVFQPWVAKGRTIGSVDAHRGGRRFIVRADEKLNAFVELERQVLTVTFYLESIHADAL
jgi:hypothetical protein